MSEEETLNAALAAYRLSCVPYPPSLLTFPIRSASPPFPLSCRPRYDGRVDCWGAAAHIGKDPPDWNHPLPADTGYVALYKNWYAWVGVKADGSVKAWGDPTYGGELPAGGLGNWTHIYSNRGSFVAMRSDGSLVCWGKDNNGGERSKSIKRDVNRPSLPCVASLSHLGPCVPLLLLPGAAMTGSYQVCPTDVGFKAVYATNTAWVAISANDTLVRLTPLSHPPRLSLSLSHTHTHCLLALALSAQQPLPVACNALPLTVVSPLGTVNHPRAGLVGNVPILLLRWTKRPQDGHSIPRRHGIRERAYQRHRVCGAEGGRNGAVVWAAQPRGGLPGDPPQKVQPER